MFVSHSVGIIQGGSVLEKALTHMFPPLRLGLILNELIREATVCDVVYGILHTHFP